MKIKIIILLVLSFSTIACSSYHNRSAQDRNMHNRNMTVGTVQKEIKLGMSSIDVATALGSPNIVQTDEHRNEVWIYDKISTQINSSSSHAGVWFLYFYAGGNETNSNTSQRTLTVVIKFDDDSKIKDFSYHTSRF